MLERRLHHVVRAGTGIERVGEPGHDPGVGEREVLRVDDADTGGRVDVDDATVAQADGRAGARRLAVDRVAGELVEHRARSVQRVVDRERATVLGHLPVLVGRAVVHHHTGAVRGPLHQLRAVPAIGVGVVQARFGTALVLVADLREHVLEEVFDLGVVAHVRELGRLPDLAQLLGDVGNSVAVLVDEHVLELTTHLVEEAAWRGDGAEDVLGGVVDRFDPGRAARLVEHILGEVADRASWALRVRRIRIRFGHARSVSPTPFRVTRESSR